MSRPKCPKCGKPLCCHVCISRSGGSKTSPAKKAAQQINLVKARAARKEKMLLRASQPKHKTV